jgi:hypothetical protein
MTMLCMFSQALVPYILQATPVAANDQLVSNPAMTSSASINPPTLLPAAPLSAGPQLPPMNTSSVVGALAPVCSSVSGHHIACAAPSRASSVTSPGIPLPQASGGMSAGLPLGMAPGLPVAPSPACSVVSGASAVEKLEADARNMTVQAQMLQEQAQKCIDISHTSHSGGLAEQAHVQAESFQFKAASLDKAAEASILQAKAVQHQQAEVRRGH